MHLSVAIALGLAASLNLAGTEAVNLTEEVTFKDKPKGRVFSLFSIVTFKNSECTGQTDTTLRGTCYTSSECSTKGGISTGNCAAGFGVCCLFMLSTCGSTVSQNSTYIQNTGYPTSFTTTTTSTSSCTYSVRPVDSSICQLRLDFVNFVTGVDATTGACLDRSATSDSFVVKTPNLVTYPVICGINTGYHMYVETSSSTTPSTLTFNFGTATAVRTWRVKISQIECYSMYKAPEGCFQYFTGESGTIQSFGYGGPQMLQGLQYNACIRQELGFCSIDYSEASTITPDPFTLGSAVTTALTDTNCATTAALIIPTSPTNGVLYCGAYLSTVNGDTTSGSVTDATGPFILGVQSLVVSQGALTGFNLKYSQVPCSS